MAIHLGHLPRPRHAPRPDMHRDRASRTPSLGTVIPMYRLNELTADGATRLRLTSIFIIGLTALVAALSII